MRFLKAFLTGAVVCLPIYVNAGAAEDCFRKLVIIQAENPTLEYGSISYELTIENQMSIDLSGAIISHILWAEGRPLPLATGGYSETAHTFGGALLSGELATFKEYIGVSEREYALAEAAPKLRVELVLENVADLETHPFGKSNDPYGYWSTVVSTKSCERKPE